MKVRVGILGGGVAGISVARLLNSSFDVTILEAEATAGGLARSFEFMGVHYDIGPHIIFSRNKQVLNYMLQTDPNLVEHRRSNQIWYKGRLIEYPFENYLGQLPAEERDHCLHTFLNNPYRQYEPTNMQQFFLANFGAGITRTYLQPYNQKIWKYDPAYLDLQMVSRIPRPPDEDVIAGARGEYREGYTHQARFHYPRAGGIQSFFNAMASSLPSHSKLLVGKKVERISQSRSPNKQGQGWAVYTHDVSTHIKESFQFDLLINCMPLENLFAALQLAVPHDVSSAVRDLKFNSLIFGLAVFKSDRAGNHFSFNIPQEEVVFHRISKMDFLSSGHRSSFLFEITTPSNAVGLIHQSDAEIRERVIRGFEFMKLARGVDLLGIEVRRVRQAYVIYDLFHRRNVERILSFLRSLSIPCCGRFAEHEYLNMDGVIEHAMNLAQVFNEGVYPRSRRRAQI